MPRHQYATQQQAAAHFRVTPKTIRNWISEGLITGYRLPGGRAIRVDLDEITNQMRAMPTLRPKVPFGPKAKIVTVVEAWQPPEDTGGTEGVVPDGSRPRR